MKNLLLLLEIVKYYLKVIFVKLDVKSWEEVILEVRRRVLML